MVKLLTKKKAIRIIFGRDIPVRNLSAKNRSDVIAIVRETNKSIKRNR